MTDTIHTKVKATWDIKTAYNCRLPELIPDICERCRDYKYCHRQLTLDDMRGEKNERSNKQTISNRRNISSLPG